MTPRSLARQAPLSTGLSRQEHWSGCRALLLTPGWSPGLLHCRQIPPRLSHQGRLAQVVATLLQITLRPLLTAVQPTRRPLPRDGLPGGGLAEPPVLLPEGAHRLACRQLRTAAVSGWEGPADACPESATGRSPVTRAHAFSLHLRETAGGSYLSRAALVTLTGTLPGQ